MSDDYQKMNCSCHQSYTSRKMVDPNCCSCNCDYNELVDAYNKAILDVGTTGFENDQLKAQVAELERERDEAKKAFQAFSVVFDTSPTGEQVVMAKDWLAKRDLEQRIEGVSFLAEFLEKSAFTAALACKEKDFSEVASMAIEQLRKGAGDE